MRYSITIIGTNNLGFRETNSILFNDLYEVEQALKNVLFYGTDITIIFFEYNQNRVGEKFGKSKPYYLNDFVYTSRNKVIDYLKDDFIRNF